MLSAGAVDKHGKWRRNGACLLGATSAVSVLNPSPSLSRAAGPAQVQVRAGRRRLSRAAESTGVLEIAFHGQADWDTNPSIMCQALGEEIRFD